MEHRGLVLRAVALGALLALSAAAAIHARLEPCRSLAPAGEEQAASPNWLVGFHRMPWGLREGGTYLGARVEHVDDELRWISVTADWACFPKVADVDPRVRYVEPNHVIGS